MTDREDRDLLRPYTEAPVRQSEMGPCVVLGDTRPWMIDFEKRSGHREALYIGLLTSTTFVPGARDVITMRFSGWDVALSGTSLGPLYDALLEQRVARIKEVDPLTLGERSTTPIVREIAVTPNR